MSGKFIDFEAIKEAVSVEKAAQLLHLEVTSKNGQLRAACPACKAGGSRALAITPAKRSYYCFAAEKGGDVISLVAHIRGVSMKDAAVWLSEDSSSTAPPAPAKGKEGERTFQPLEGLEFEHDAVLAVGFDPKDAERLGIGYCGKGLMRGLVAIPLRTEDGTLVGYAGVTEAKLPKELHFPKEAGNVVKFPRSA